MIKKPTSKEFKDKWYKDNCWDWQNSGIHAYNVLRREENAALKGRNINNWSKFEKWACTQVNKLK